MIAYLIVLLRLISETLDGHTHILGEVRTAVVELHHATAGVVLAVPDDLVGGGLCEKK